MYTYDGLGNILRKYTYAYSAGALGEFINETRYSYTDSTWGDALNNNLNALKSGIQNKLAFLKLFVCFF